MKRTFTKYPSGYVKASEDFPSDNIYHVDFYDMIGDLIPLKTVYLFADSKEEARQLGKELAVALGYKSDKVMVQYAYITEGYLDRYYEPQEESGITNFIRKR